MIPALQVLKMIFSLKKITKNSTWCLLNPAIRNVFYGNRSNDPKPATWILSDGLIQRSNRKSRPFVKFLVDRGRTALFPPSKLLSPHCMDLPQNENSSTDAQYYISTSVNKYFARWNRVGNAHTPGKTRGGRKTCLWDEKNLLQIQTPLRLAGTQRPEKRPKCNSQEQEVGRRRPPSEVPLLSVTAVGCEGSGRTLAKEKGEVGAAAW